MDDQPPGSLSPPPARERDARARAAPGYGPGSVTAPPQPPSRRAGLWLLLLLLVVAGVVAWVLLRSGREAAQSRRFQSTGPMPVGTAKVTQGDMPVTLTGLGTVTPLATVTVQTQIAGQLVQVGFQEGQMVKQGDFLAQIDPRPYQVALEQAEGQLAKDQAALKDAELDLARYKKLVAQNSIATQQLDTQAALVQQDIGTVKSDQAQVDTQKLNLVYCHIVSPVTGRVGLRQVDAGNYITPTSLTNGIVVVTELQPISVIFTLPEDSLTQVLQQMAKGAKLSATAYDRTGATKLDTGSLETIDNQIDTTTGTVKLRAIFNNPQMILFPNQFVNVQLLVDTMHGTDIVPTAAIQRGAPGTFVYVVKPDNTVTAQPVTLGPSSGDNVAITKGVQPGQVVVIDGADRLKEGAKVRVAENGATGAPAGTNGAPAGNGTSGAAANGAGSAQPGTAAQPNAAKPQSGQHHHRDQGQDHGQGQTPAPGQAPGQGQQNPGQGQQRSGG